MQYSAIKINANLTDPYSTLNPDTSSDSPSAKSKGVRFSSAKQVTLHTKKAGRTIKNSLLRGLGTNNKAGFLLLQKMKRDKQTNARLIS